MNDLVWAHGGFTIKKTSIWFVPYNCNFLCEFDMKKKTINTVELLPYVSNCADLCLNTLNYKKYIVTVPSYSNSVCIYNTEKGTLQECILKQGLKSAKFFCYAIYNSYIFFSLLDVMKL